MYGYTGWRLRLAQLPLPWSRIAGIIMIGLLLLVPAGILAENLGPPSFFKDVLSWAAYINLGFFSMLFIFFLSVDIIKTTGRMGSRTYQVFKHPSANRPDPTLKNPSRRQSLIHIVNLSLLSITGFLTIYGLVNARRRPRIVNIKIPVEGLPTDLEGFRIVQISDLHIGPTIKKDFVDRVVDSANKLDADIIALTGDLVDGSVNRLEGDVEPLSRLSAKYGRFVITGNHEYYSGVLLWIQKFKSLGLDMLLNENRLITKGNGKLLIGGVTDYSAGSFIPSHVSSPRNAMRNAPDNDYKILLAHQPKSVEEASEAGFDLVLSGHTHGGQYFPFNQLIHLAQPYVKGLHNHKGTLLYINSGTGYWGPPLRIGVPSEITQIELIRKS